MLVAGEQAALSLERTAGDVLVRAAGRRPNRTSFTLPRVGRFYRRPQTAITLRNQLLGGDLAPVGGHGEDVGENEDAEAPCESDPDVAAGRLLCKQILDRVDD
jgi:hypothetical protein